MAKDLGASIIIENKPGAGTIIGAQAVAAAEGDGYTLLMGTFAHAVNPSLNAKLPFDPNKDFAAPPDELGRYYRSEVERWRKVIQDAGIKIE